jgi:hypothetical protein
VLALGSWPAFSTIGMREAGATASSKPRFSFRFHPPDGTTFVQTLVMTRTTQIGPSMRRTDVTTTRTRVTIRKSPQGYTLVATPISATMTRDGRPVGSPVLEALSKLTVTYEIDAKGKIAAIRGYENVAQALRASLPPETAATMARTLTPEALVRREKSEWDGRVGRYVGRSAGAGDSWVTTDEFPLPDGGKAVFHSATRFDAAPGSAQAPRLRMKFRYDTDAEALTRLTGKPIRNLPRKAGVSTNNSQISDVAIKGSGERLVDPTTMLIYEESATRTVTMKMEIPGQGRHNAVTEEKRVYRYNYQTG